MVPYFLSHNVEKCILYIKQALKMFQSAKNVSIVANQPALQKEIKEELNILTSFCKLNGIILKRENH